MDRKRAPASTTSAQSMLGSDTAAPTAAAIPASSGSTCTASTIAPVPADSIGPSTAAAATEVHGASTEPAASSVATTVLAGLPVPLVAASLGPTTAGRSSAFGISEPTLHTTSALAAAATVGNCGLDSELAGTATTVPQVPVTASVSSFTILDHNVCQDSVLLPNRLLEIPFQVAQAKFISGNVIPKGTPSVLVAELYSARLAVGYAKTSLDMPADQRTFIVPSEEIIAYDQGAAECFSPNTPLCIGGRPFQTAFPDCSGPYTLGGLVKAMGLAKLDKNVPGGARPPRGKHKTAAVTAASKDGASLQENIEPHTQACFHLKMPQNQIA
ncbi:hypothetical protein WJX77_010742 [Trebouxia sp. C0004]